MSAVSAQQQHDAVTIVLNGDFTFAIHAGFRGTYKRYPRTSKFIVDLSRSGYMDSAGLGMLIQLRDYAGGDNADVSIQGCNDAIKEILTIANFERLFRYV